MIEYKQPTTGKDFLEESRNTGTPAPPDGKLSLTKLWEIIVRTKRLPDGFDEQILFTGVRDRLRDPEREVRQHALRVLSDLIPVTQPITLDDHMRPLIPELLTNLGHPAPALRKGALDTLRIYLKYSEHSDALLKDLITTKPEDPRILTAAPYLINNDTDDQTLTFIVDQLWKMAGSSSSHQQAAVKALAKIRRTLGDDRFQSLVDPEFVKELQDMCNMYGLPVDYSDSNSTEGEKRLWSSEEVVEDKVILETEITLRTGPAITMKIHEESRANSVNGGVDSEEEVRQDVGVVRILAEDSESDYYESARRTPRKVRFGGEIVKMRTPESDSNNEGSSDMDHQTSIHITVTDAVSIRTRRSLIPVRITSLPSTPRKKASLGSKRLNKSTPDLTVNTSRIPLRREKTSTEKVPHEKSPSKNVAVNKDDPKVQPQNPALVAKPLIVLPNQERRNSRSEDVFSPIPVHNEIEVFHNLTRSPEHNRKTVDGPLENTKPKETLDDDAKNNNKTKSESSPVLPQQEENIANIKNEVSSKAVNTYNSFQVCQEDSEKATEKQSAVVKGNKKIVEAVQKTPIEQQGQVVNKTNGEQENSARPEALDSLHKILKEPNICETLEPGPAALFFEALFACHHKDRLHTLADEALSLLVNNLRLDVLNHCLRRLTLGLCRMGAPSGVKLALTAMKRIPPNKLQLEIIEQGFGHRTREGALQVLMASARLFPSNEVEVKKIAEFATNALRDRRRRVRQAALETLATLAQLGTSVDVLEVVQSIIGSSLDQEYLMNVIRTRLSRKQLPTVELDGTVRYSTPRDQTEVDWLSGTTKYSSSPSSSASSTTPSKNYWRHNLRHEENISTTTDLGASSTDHAVEETNHGNEQTPIWAVDPSFLPKAAQNGNIKGANLRPIYVLQPEGVAISPQEIRGHRKYDRGRSFSPPKHQRRVFNESQQGVVGSAPHHSEQATKRTFKYSESFRKSFSSEQLYSEKQHHEPYSFSMSSRSSTTSTGSSTRSGIWQRDFRSGIPIPISSETKLRLRINSVNQNGSNNGPVKARRTTLASPQGSPVVCRLSPQIVEDVEQEPAPPRSSGSESSGYFTPPPEAQQAFVKLDTEEHSSEPEENNNIPHQDSVESITDKGSFLVAQQDNFTASSAETSDAAETEEVAPLRVAINHNAQESIETNNFQLKESPYKKHATSTSLDELDFIELAPPRSDIGKSKSVADLKSFLPEIVPPRKNINSAPPLNDELNLLNNNIIIGSNRNATPPSPAKNILPGSVECFEDKEPAVKDVPNCKLTRRFTRSLSKRSIRSLTRTDSQSSTAPPRPVSKPKEALQQALVQMESNEWETTVQGLQGLMKVIRNHPETVELQIHAVCVGLGKHIKNLRSQVSRTACLAASELFSSCKKGIDVEVEEVAGPLLQRTADTNRFLRADANSALDTMCDQLPIGRVITVITAKGCCHQNAVVRAASARLLNDLVTRFGPEKIMLLPKEIRDRVLLAGANSLTDGSLDARRQAKSMLSILMGHHSFQRAFGEAVPQHILRHIAKTLNSLKSPAKH